MQMLNIALPKGRLGDEAYGVLSAAGYSCEGLEEDSRKLIFENAELGLRYFWAKPSDVGVYVERGAADVGIVGRTPAEQVAAMARFATGAGADGLVCSPLEVGALSRALSAGTLFVTPGVRPAGAAVGDQRRVATPADAVRDGATHLVVGRPVLAAADPAAAALAIRAEMGA